MIAPAFRPRLLVASWLCAIALTRLEALSLPDCREVREGVRLCRACRGTEDAEPREANRYWVFGPWRVQAEADAVLETLSASVPPSALHVRYGLDGYELLLPAAAGDDAEKGLAARGLGALPMREERSAPFVDPPGSGPLELYWLELDPRRVRIEAAHSLDAALGLETTRSLVGRRGALAGINGGFFATSGPLRGESTGLWIHRGRLLSEPDRGRGAVGFQSERGRVVARFGRPQASLWLRLGERRVPVAGVNRERRAGERVVYTPEFHRTTLTWPGGTELIVREGRVQEIICSAASRPIPENGFVVSLAPGVSLDGLAIGVPATWEFELHGWADSEKAVPGEAVSAGPLLLATGRSVLEPERESISKVFCLARHPRTAVGARHDGVLLFLVADGRAPGRSHGASLPELQEILLELGAVDAVNLDGGGSTTLVVEGRVINHPSDRAGERENGDALLVFLVPSEEP